MAVLAIDEYSLEISYHDFSGGWISYDMLACWNGEPILNESLLKRESGFRVGRGKGVIRANEHRSCGVLNLLTVVLRDKKSDIWEATDPDVTLTVRMPGHSPFSSGLWQLAWEAPHIKTSRLAREAARAEAGGILPDDHVELSLHIDTYNFRGANAYGGDGPCFRYTPTWAQLHDFRDALRNEYRSFAARHDIDGFNRREIGDTWKTPEY